MVNFNGKKALITGGASGIGLIMARLSLERGAQVVLWDIDAEGLERAIEQLSPIGPATGYCVNVAEKESVDAAYLKVLRQHGAIDILINNAGIVVGKFFHDHTYGDIVRTMEINSIAPMYATLVFMQGMMARGSGSICNIASLAGLISNPRMSVYAASKWAVIGWSDSVRLEMKRLGTNVSVTTVMPYYINTGMFDGVRSRVPLLDPEKTARKIIRAIERGKPVLAMPWSMRFVRFMQGCVPSRFFDWNMDRTLKIYRTMDGFTGRMK